MNAIQLAISWVLGVVITLLLSPLFLILWAGQKVRTKLGSGGVEAWRGERRFGLRDADSAPRN